MNDSNNLNFAARLPEENVIGAVNGGAKPFPQIVAPGIGIRREGNPLCVINQLVHKGFGPLRVFTRYEIAYLAQIGARTRRKAYGTHAGVFCRFRFAIAR